MGVATRRRATLLLLGAMTLGGVTEAREATANESTRACAVVAADDEFADVPAGSTHEAAIDCLAWWGLTVGNDGNYLPASDVTRGQIASFLARTLTAASVQLPDQFASSYRDAVGVHATSIDQLASLDVIDSSAGERYRPAAPLLRGDMAAFLVAAHRTVTGARVAGAADEFPDVDGHPRHDAINQAAKLGLTRGKADGTYDPGGTVTRAQMASFLTRLLELLVADGHGEPPSQPVWQDVPPGRTAFLPLPDAPAGSFSFFIPSKDGYGMRWNPCQTIPVVANFAGAPRYAKLALLRAIDRLRDGLGTDVRFAGTTKELMPSHGTMSEKSGRVLVNWPPKWTAGYAAMTSIRPMSDGWLEAATVSLNRSRPLSQVGLKSLLMHELGHAVGLGHTDHSNQIMHQRVPPTGQWGAGDLAGLARVGGGVGCGAPQISAS